MCVHNHAHTSTDTNKRAAVKLHLKKKTQLKTGGEKELIEFVHSKLTNEKKASIEFMFIIFRPKVKIAIKNILL